MTHKQLKILIFSPAFYPKVGGLETVVLILAKELHKLGHEIKVVCTTTAEQNDNPFPFEVIRNPNPKALLEVFAWSDIFFQHNISLKGIWPLLFIKRPWVTTHHGYYERSDGKIAWQDRLKLLLTKYTNSISISKAVADRLPHQSTVIGNPYDQGIFLIKPEIQKIHDLVFVGRLVSDKGVDILLHALSILQKKNIKPTLNIIGTGPEEIKLKSIVQDLSLQAEVGFLGKITGTELCDILNSHKFIVIPSLWEEPFGVVALEGIACGCYAIGSEGGGLKDAIGDCGSTFPNGNIEKLATIIYECISGNLSIESSKRESHLKNFTPEKVAKEYLNYFATQLKTPS